jgi:hypothetical protein
MNEFFQNFRTDKICGSDFRIYLIIYPENRIISTIWKITGSFYAYKQ